MREERLHLNRNEYPCQSRQPRRFGLRNKNRLNLFRLLRLTNK